MILNSFALLDAFVTLLRWIVGICVVGLSIMAWSKRSHSMSRGDPDAAQNQFYLLFSLSFLLLGLNVVSWPLLYMLLQSLVTQWPGVMCIYGVTQIGAGSIGPARFSPTILALLEASKPIVVFASGAWFVLYLLNRRTATAPLTGRVLAMLTIAGLVATADAGLEASYLVIPKTEEFPNATCCTEAIATSRHDARFLPALEFPERFRPWLSGSYYAVNGGLILLLVHSIVAPRPMRPRRRLVLLLMTAAISVPISAAFLVKIGAPGLLRLPFHPCPYDLIARVPESTVGIALYIFGIFTVGWSCVAFWLADCPQTQPFLWNAVCSILRLGVFGCVGSMVMMIVGLALPFP